MPEPEAVSEPSPWVVSALASVVLMAGAFAWYSSESLANPAPPVVLASRLINGSLLP